MKQLKILTSAYRLAALTAVTVLFAAGFSRADVSFTQTAEPDNGSHTAGPTNYSTTDYFDVNEGGSAAVAAGSAPRFTSFGYDSQPDDAIGAALDTGGEPGRFLFADVGVGANEALDLFQSDPGLAVQSVRVVVASDGALGGGTANRGFGTLRFYGVTGASSTELFSDLTPSPASLYDYLFTFATPVSFDHYQIDMTGTGQGTRVVEIEANLAAPEPTSLGLLACGSLLVLRRRRA